MPPNERERMEGVNVSDLEPIVDAVSFPVTAEEIVVDHGDRALKRTNAAPITVEELLEPLGDASFESAEDLETMIVGQMPAESTGRTGYSDRGGSRPTGTDEDEQRGENDDMANANTASGDAEDGDTANVTAENGDSDTDDSDRDDAESV